RVEGQLERLTPERSLLHRRRRALNRAARLQAAERVDEGLVRTEDADVRAELTGRGQLPDADRVDAVAVVDRQLLLPGGQLRAVRGSVGGCDLLRDLTSAGEPLRRWPPCRPA